MSNTELLNQLLNLSIWKTKDDNENYEVSISGSVRNVKTKRILKPYIRGIGYYCVKLLKNNICKNLPIHRLVANAFLPNVENKECVDHIDSNKLNNTISNLRWCSNQENSFNRQLSSNNTSTIKGVRFENNKWRAQICFNYKKIHIGYFDSLEDAKQARQKKAAENNLKSYLKKWCYNILNYKKEK